MKKTIGEILLKNSYDHVYQNMISATLRNSLLLEDLNSTITTVLAFDWVTKVTTSFITIGYLPREKFLVLGIATICMDSKNQIQQRILELELMDIFSLVNATYSLEETDPFVILDVLPEYTK